MKRDVWITGCGLISALGEGRAANWATLNDPAAWPARMDSQKLAPHTIHPMVPLELGRYIPRPGDQRAMGPLMQTFPPRAWRWRKRGWRAIRSCWRAPI
jgi:3-oxoacyl-[acyl-carrier-protein] synthase II